MLKVNDLELDMIKKTFDKDYTVKRVESFQDDALYITTDNEVVVFKLFTDESFTPLTLADFTILAEEVWEKYMLHVNVHVLLMPYCSVEVAECNIKSEADFSITLAKSRETATDIRNRCDLVLDIIKSKIDDDTVTSSDVEVLQLIPLKCSREDRLHYRGIVFDLLTRIDNECSISLS